MIASESECSRVVVMKLGGSILTGPISYQRAARFIRGRTEANPREDFVVVVSAQNGETDALLREAEALLNEPNPAALDLLWSTGELRSVARLALHLQAGGVRVAALDVRQTGLQIEARGMGVAAAEFDARCIRSALATHRVVIVPGFLATDSAGAVVTLGRGGSDLTAVLLAAGLEASRCELIKDVPGYFTEDPNVNPEARHLARISFAVALKMAGEGCELVQRAALEAAKSCDLPIVVRGLEENGGASWVTDRVEVEERNASEPAVAEVNS